MFEHGAVSGGSRQATHRANLPRTLNPRLERQRPVPEVTVRTTIPRALHQAERWLGATYDTTAGKALPRNTIRVPIS